MVYLLLDALGAVAVALYFLSIPPDPKNSFFFGYSLPRLIISGGFILISLTCLFAAYKTRQKKAPIIKLIKRVFECKLCLLTVFLAANILLLAGLALFITKPSPVHILKYIPMVPASVLRQKAYIERLMPVFLWVTLVSAQTILGLVYLYTEQLKDSAGTGYDRSSTRVIVILVCLTTLSILAVGLSKALPFFLMANKTQALQFARTDNMRNIHNYAWGLAIYINLIAAWIWPIKFSRLSITEIGNFNPFRYFFPIIIAAFISYYCLTVIVAGDVGNNHSPSNWNVFYVSPDSGGYVERYSAYSIRPPMYPLFIQLVTTGTGFDHKLDRYPINQPIRDTSDPLMRVTRAQKLILITSSLLACAALMGLMNSPLPALFFLGLYEFGFFSQEINHILSESLAQTWLFLILAGFFTFFWKRWKFLLPLSGAFCATLYLTRPAGVYGGVLLTAMLLWAIKADWQKYRLSCLAAVLLPVVLVAIPIFYTYLATGSLSPAPMYGHAQIAFALQVAGSDDLSLMSDEQAREFLIKALEVKQIEDAKIKVAEPDATSQLLNMLSSNIYRVAIPIANEILPNTSNQSSLLIKVSTPLLTRHRAEYLLIGWNSFWYAATQMSMDRIINKPFSLGIVILISLILALYLRGWVGYCSISLILTHLAHMVIVSMFDFPLTRYLWATELLVFIGGFILIWGIFNRLTEH
jgi:hypothetical protein